ncbi:MAG: hypothetical protein WA667_23965 [Candidatus Nitrosopolaris sp.]
MLGDQIAELKGKIIGHRVLDVEGPTIERSVLVEGSFRGIQVKEHLTYIAKPVSAGVVHGNGQGVIMAGESEMATFIAQGIGRLGPSGVRWRGSGFFRTSSNGKLAFLNNVVGVFETEVDTEGNFTEKIWEWK